MNESATALAPWQGFYVIVGSSGGALIGVQFVVITLLAYMRHSTTASSINAFATPTVVHLAGALFVSAIMSAPWPALVDVAVALAMCGLGGLAYGATVIRGVRRQTAYRPVWDDWLWYALLPCSLYAALALTAIFLRTNTPMALFAVGAATLSLLFIGIHNAWDTVTHFIVSHSDSTELA